MSGALVAILTALAMLVPTTAAAVTPPPTAGVADYQLGGAYEPDPDVAIVIRDHTDEPVEGRYSVCYVNAFQTQPGTLSWWRKHHPSLLLRDARKRLVRDRNWPDEVLLDIRTPARRARLGVIAGRWFRGCAADGFAAVEPDNLDAWTRSRRLITRQQTVAFARHLVKRAHTSGLAIAQKNTPELSRTRIGFDFAVAEECEVYAECGDYTDRYGSRVIEIEYTDNGREAYERACTARAGTHSILLRDRDVVPRGESAYVFEHC